MKRKLTFLLALCLMCSLLGCGRSGEDELGNVRETACEIALIVPGKSLRGDSQSQKLWDGILTYAKSGGVTCRWFGANASGVEDFEKAISKAVSKGARVIVGRGSDFEQAAVFGETEYLDVSFILMDAEQSDNISEEMKHDSMARICFFEEQAGYLAGYAAVTEGYRSLGFLGERDRPSSLRYGRGFIKGADAAALELGIEAVDMKYQYLETKTSKEGSKGADAAALAGSWYEEGLNLIFTCCEEGQDAIVKAAEAADGKVIGLEDHRLRSSKALVTVVEKNLSQAVNRVLNSYYNGEFPGAETVVFDVSDGSLGLSMKGARFSEFSQERYDALCQRLSDMACEEDAERKQEPSLDGLSTQAVNISFAE